MKTLSTLTICIALTLAAIGCGGKGTQAPPPTVANAAGIWTGTFTSTPTVADPKVHVSKIALNLSQGAQVTDASGLPSAPLSAALVINSPDCLAVVNGKGAGTITQDAIHVTLSLSDGGTLTVDSGLQPDPNPNHFFSGKYTFNTGTCSPQFGTADATR